MNASTIGLSCPQNCLHHCRFTLSLWRNSETVNKWNQKLFCLTWQSPVTATFVGYRRISLFSATLWKEALTFGQLIVCTYSRNGRSRVKCRTHSGVNASSKLGGRSAEGGGVCSLPTGNTPSPPERSLGGGNFFVLWSKNGVFWWILRC